MVDLQLHNSADQLTDILFKEKMHGESIKWVRLRRPREGETNKLPWFDFTRLTAINTCPTWGMIRYIEGLRFGGARRELALEAGQVSHDVYAAVRLHDMIRNFSSLHQDFAELHGPKLLGKNRWNNMMRQLGDDKDERTERMAFALEALYDSDYQDDPGDKARTMVNIEEACMAYIDRWDYDTYPTFIDHSNNKSTIGVEVPFGFVVDFGSGATDDMERAKSYYIVGRIDGLHWYKDELRLHENKTANRLSESWINQWETSHQLTTYSIGASLITGRLIHKGYVLGMQIPQPKSANYGGIVREPFERTYDAWWTWCQWVYNTILTYEKYKSNVDAAPRYTHSCSRYFRTCSFLPYCASDAEERVELLSEMTKDEWHPHGVDHTAMETEG